MAEVLGLVASGITVAALFSSCIEAFDLIECMRNHPEDYKILLVKLEIEKCRLYQWGESLGLSKGQPDEVSIFKDIPFKSLIIEILSSIFLLFSNAERVRDRYGCVAFTAVPRTKQLSHASSIFVDDILKHTFNNLKISTHVKSKGLRVDKRLRWVAGDKTKFGRLLADLKDLVDGLESITRALPAVNEIECRMKTRIASIRSRPALEMVAEACSETRQDLAETASLKLELLSTGVTTFNGIEQWNEAVTRSKNKAEFLTPENWRVLADATVNSLNEIALRLYGVTATCLPPDIAQQLGVLFWNVVLNLLDQPSSNMTGSANKSSEMWPIIPQTPATEKDTSSHHPVPRYSFNFSNSTLCQGYNTALPYSRWLRNQS